MNTNRSLPVQPRPSLLWVLPLHPADSSCTSAAPSHRARSDRRQPLAGHLWRPGFQVKKIRSSPYFPPQGFPPGGGFIFDRVHFLVCVHPTVQGRRRDKPGASYTVVPISRLMTQTEAQALPPHSRVNVIKNLLLFLASLFFWRQVNMNSIQSIDTPLVMAQCTRLQTAVTWDDFKF